MRILQTFVALLALDSLAQPTPERGKSEFESLPRAHFKFTGPVGERVDANVDNWLLRAPQANPGMLEMFRVRDRQPVPQLVPWAGEFVGKYLISAVQALRMTDDPRLFPQVSNVVHAFIATQADDGYLGPFPKDIRLLKNWDLWGHYHALQALALWHQHTGDPAALAAARRAADLVCKTYLDTNRRVFDAGDSEMNMAILTGMAMMYRLTGEARYLRMAREVEMDWERAGDYLRAGLDGREYFQGPKPRWESLHDLQGLVELWRITGEVKYREAFIHHWRSIRRWDRRNTGAFSSGEQATGNPFAPTAIETCCTVAWMALTIDYLKLTGDPLAADELELSTLNGGLGAQHPSGRWWTYNTPMDGTREASAHTIVFQSRAGTPELNCCSVNAPRVLGALSEWAVVAAGDGLVVNSFVPAEISAGLGGQDVVLKLDQDYPRTNTQRIVVTKSDSHEWTLRLRIPHWSKQAGVKASFEGPPDSAKPGTYLEIRRRWKAGDEVSLQFDFALRAVAGANETAGKVSLYRGPLLLAYDQAVNEFDPDKIPPVDLARLREAQTVIPKQGRNALETPAWLEVELPAERGRLRLVDFANAGRNGTHYRSWLPATQAPPPPAFTTHPRDGEYIRPGAAFFAWRGTRNASNINYRVEIAADAAFTRFLLATNAGTARQLTLDLAALSPSPLGGERAGVRGAPRNLAPGGGKDQTAKTPLTLSLSPPRGEGTERWWRVVSIGANGETLPDVPPARFTLDPSAPPQKLPPVNKPGPNGELLLHSLRGEESPKFGELLSAKHESRTAEGTKLNGRDQMLVYSIPVWPEQDFTVAVRVRVDELPKGRIGQIFSAWAAGMDDPLRLTVDGGKVSARIEAGNFLSTPGVAIKAGEWHHVAAVKQGTKLELFLDGQPAGSKTVSEYNTTTAHDCALGGNPHFSGNEFLAATFADFGFWERALSAAELNRLASRTER